MKWKSIFQIFLAFILLTMLFTAASALKVEISNTTGQVGSEVSIPVAIMDSTDLGGMNLVIAYDAEVLKPVKVEKGDIVKGLFSSDLSKSGLISIGLVDSNGINGDGRIAVIKFEVLKEGETPLKILHFKAYNVKTHVDMKAELKDGYFKTEVKKETPPPTPTQTEAKKSPGFEVVSAAFVIAAIAAWRRKRV